MLFHSIEFIFGFLPLTFLAFVVVHSIWGRQAGLAWLAIASIIFYAQWSLVHGALLVVSLLVNFLLCRSIIASGDRLALRRGLFFAAIAANLGLLGYMKYANFLVDNINVVAGTDMQFTQLIALVGVSFFTFIQIGMIVEVYNRQLTHIRLFEYFLFGSFFAYVTAGPLALQRDMFPQYADKDQRAIDLSRIAVALTIFGFGLFKKLALADSVAPFADAVFNGTAAGAIPSISLAWIGALAYTTQLYFDFSGYSDMAVGIGLLFGLRLPFNFNSPLKATSITDFWRRWHMTMTRFFTAYVYSPLAVSNSRRALINKYSPIHRYLVAAAVPVFVTFLLAGIWHGAGWTFVVFGVIHGLAMAINHAWTHAKMPKLPDACGWMLTMLVVVVGLVVFRAPDLATAGQLCMAMIGLVPGGEGWTVTAGAIAVDYADAVGLVTILLAIALLLPNTQQILSQHNISSDPADYEIGRAHV